MDLEKSQIFANVSAALSNLAASGVISREQAKELIKPYLPYVNHNNTLDKIAGIGVKSKVVGASDVK